MNRLPLHVFTLALNSMPWIASIYSELTRLPDVSWKWIVVHGAAMNVADTRWMQKQAPHLSDDGTTEFLHAISCNHPRITVCEAPSWPGKKVMCDAALAHFTEPGVLLQQDSDELWSADQYRRIVELFEDDPALNMARFHCRFFLGPNVITTDAGKPEEWLRAWRYQPGMTFDTHEPPVLSGNQGKSMTRVETARLALVFEHHSYSLPKHVSMKEKLYNRPGLLAGWHKLQANTEWPLRDAGKFLPKAFAGAPADKIF